MEKNNFQPEVQHTSPETNRGIIASLKEKFTSTIDEIRPKDATTRDIAGRATRIVAALAIVFGSVEVTKNAERPTYRDKEVTSTAPEADISNQRTRELQNKAEEDEAAEAILELEDIEVTEQNQEFLNEAKDFLEANKELRGKERLAALEEYTLKMGKYYKMANRNGASNAELEAIANVWVATYHEYNSLSKAGTMEDIIAAGEKTGMVSESYKEEVREALLDETSSYRIDLDERTVEINGETFQIDDEAIFTQIIGSGPFSTGIQSAEGITLTGVHDMESTDPEAFREVRENAGQIERLIDAQWESIVESIEDKDSEGNIRGIDVNDDNAQIIRESVLKSLQTGEDVSVQLPSGEEFKSRASDFRILDWAVEIGAGFEEFYGIPIPKIEIRAEKESAEEERNLEISSDLEVISGKISPDILCEGNKAHIIIGNLEIVVDPAKTTEETGVDLPFYLLAALLVLANRKRESNQEGLSAASPRMAPRRYKYSGARPAKVATEGGPASSGELRDKFQATIRKRQEQGQRWRENIEGVVGDVEEVVEDPRDPENIVSKIRTVGVDSNAGGVARGPEGPAGQKNNKTARYRGDRRSR